MIESNEKGKKAIMAELTIQVYDEVLDFLLKSPTPQEIITFKVSPQAQKRLQTLLLKNREATLTDNENAELDVYEKLEHLMILLKARAISLDF
ncbi:hypothetical protein [Aphanothece hegewaldii]|uniref:hypothetical protein n=1 Tax=Aphanothece hegewaldii TaxID=1521625 RepID=UPI001C62F4DF|nr:hypothetical protein [Aphanothece hegewaldii]